MIYLISRVFCLDFFKFSGLLCIYIQSSTIIGRYDVDIPKRVKMPVYWKDGLNDEMKVCRASWFYKSVNTWVPYEEIVAAKLEEEYVNCCKTSQWQREIRISENKAESGVEARIRMISADMIYHLPSDNSSLAGKLDEWGQVQPPSQDPSQMPREVRRGIEGIIHSSMHDLVIRNPKKLHLVAMTLVALIA